MAARKSDTCVADLRCCLAAASSAQASNPKPNRGLLCHVYYVSKQDSVSIVPYKIMCCLDV
jgi:hypothetical protein